MSKKKVLPREEFRGYLDQYFLDHKYPKDLYPSFGLSVSNHSRRIRRAIELELCLSDGTEITEELYRQERLEQDSMQACDILKKHPELPSKAAYTAAYQQVSGQAKRRYSYAEKIIILGGRHLNKPYSEIQKILLHRTVPQLRGKYHEMLKRDRIPRLCSI